MNKVCLPGLFDKKFMIVIVPVLVMIIVFAMPVKGYAATLNPPGINIFVDQPGLVPTQMTSGGSINPSVSDLYTSYSGTVLVYVSFPPGSYNGYFSFQLPLTFDNIDTASFVRGGVSCIRVFGSSDVSADTTGPVFNSSFISSTITPRIYVYFNNVTVTSSGSTIVLAVDVVISSRYSTAAYLTVSSISTDSIQSYGFVYKPTPDYNDSFTNQQLENIQNGYDNSGMNDTNTQLSTSLTQYENSEGQLLQNVDFDQVEMTDVFGLGSFISTTSLFSNFLQSIYVNLGPANAIVIMSLSLSFAFAVIGYRKYIGGG